MYCGLSLRVHTTQGIHKHLESHNVTRSDDVENEADESLEDVDSGIFKSDVEKEIEVTKILEQLDKKFSKTIPKKEYSLKLNNRTPPGGSMIWNHCRKIREGGQNIAAICNYCDNRMKIAGGSTSFTRNHLLKNHADKLSASELEISTLTQ